MARDVPAALRLWLNRLVMRTPLNEAERAAIIDLQASGTSEEVNMDFVRVGEAIDSSCLIVEGLAARFAQLRNGQRSSVSLYIPGDMADLHSLVAPQVAWALRALVPTTIFRVPHGDLRALSEKHPNLSTAFWADCVADANVIAQRTVNIARKDAAGRVAHLFCEMALRLRAVGLAADDRYPFPIKQTDLGDALGLTSVHVNRVLMRLKSEGIATKTQSEVIIHDYVRLSDLAEFDWRYLEWDRPPAPESDRSN